MSLNRTPLFQGDYTVVWDGTDKSQPYLCCRRDPVRELAPRTRTPYLEGVDSLGAILGELSESAEPMTVRQLTAATGVARETCRQLVARSVRSGVVLQVGRRLEGERHYSQTYALAAAA